MYKTRIAKSLRFGRPSAGLFLLAVATTIVAVAVGQSLVFALYRTSFVYASRPAPMSTSGPPLVVGIARTPGGPSEWIAYARVFGRLQHDLGRPVVLRYSLDRNAITGLIKDRRIDIAQVPIIAYLRLRNAGAATLVAAPVVASRAHDSAVMVVARTSGFRRLEELRGARLVLTSGSLASDAFARWLLERTGSAPGTYFGSVVTSGTQDTNLGLVAHGMADAACVNRSDLAPWPAGTFRIVAESPRFGMPPIVARTGLPHSTVEAIQRSLLSVDSAAERTTGSAIGGFTIPSDRDYSFPRLLMRFEGTSALTIPNGRQ